MKLATGRVENGMIRLQGESQWPEGTPVIVLVDIRPMTWKEARTIVGPDEVGAWSGQYDVWESRGLLEPVPENRCHPTPDDLVELEGDMPPPTPEEAEDFARAMREVDEWNKGSLQRQIERSSRKAGDETTNGPATTAPNLNRDLKP
jgi:hypothetical protein